MKKVDFLKFVRHVPKYLDEFVLDDDIVFRFDNNFVLVNDSQELDHLYEYDLNHPVIRLDKRLLKVLDETEMIVLLTRCRIEKDASFLGDNPEIDKCVSSIMISKFTESMLDSTQSKLDSLLS